MYKPLSFLERKIISKTRLGILPIRLETARYLRPVLPEEERLCFCDNNEIESECHVIYKCVKYTGRPKNNCDKILMPFLAIKQ